MSSIMTNAAVAAAGRIVNSVIGIFITALLARFLGVVTYGEYSVILSYGVIFQVAADFGLYLMLTQKLGQDIKANAHFIAPIFSLRLLLLGTAFILSALGALAIPALAGNIGVLAIIYIGLICQSVSQLCMGIYQAHRSLVAATVGDIVGRVSQLGGLLLLTHIWRTQVVPSQALMLAAILFTVGTALAMAWHLSRLPLRRHLKFSLPTSEIKYILAFSWPLALSLMLSTIYFRIDMVMLPIWRQGPEIGLYAFAYRLIENVLFFPAMLGGLVLPYLGAALNAHDKKSLQGLLQESFKALMVGATGIAILFGLMPQIIINLIAGPQFMSAAPLLQILTIALVIMFFGNLFGFTLVAQEKNKFLLMLYMGLVAINIVGNALTIPHFGAYAAAWTTVVTEILACGAAAWVVTRDIPLRFSSSFLIRLLCLAAASALAAVSLPSIVGATASLLIVIITTALLAVSLRLVTPDELPRLWGRKKYAP